MNIGVMMRIYLDNCCYNRPYDDQVQLSIIFETQSKLSIQKLIKDKKIELVTSFVLDFENSFNEKLIKRNCIQKFMDKYSSIYVGKELLDIVIERKNQVMSTGIKEKDAMHYVCAELANCDFLITTDKRFLKYVGNKTKMISPEDFIKLWEEQI